jgi:hypothetical protein
VTYDAASSPGDEVRIQPCALRVSQIEDELKHPLPTLSPLKWINESAPAGEAIRKGTCPRLALRAHRI